MTVKTLPESGDAHERLRTLAESGDPEALGAAVKDLHPSDIADLLESLEDEELRIALLRALPLEVASGALAEMEEGLERAELLAGLPPERTVELLQELTDDDAADLIAELDPSEQRRILDALPAEDATELRGLLRYGEETAGGLMTTQLVSISSGLTAEEAIREVRHQGSELENFYSVFVVDGEARLLGTVPLNHLILADPRAPVASLVEPLATTVPPDLDQERVGRILSRYNLVSVPVVDPFGRLLGRITFDDVIDVIEAEQTEDILLLAGVSEEEEIKGDWREAVRSRLPWLSFNLVTAGVSASVVIFFGALLDDYWYLAAIMPIVAALGGNSGTQALAVTVRRLAVSGGPLERRGHVVVKEALVGLANGLVLGLIAAGVVWLVVWLNPDISPRLPWVVLAAMWGNILVASFAGAFIPSFLHRMGVDPAVASSVFVTALTDLSGFLLLLGLASALLL